MRRGAVARIMAASQTAFGAHMNLPRYPSLPSDQQGKVGYILLWAIGVPIPILFIIFLLRGCT